MSETVLSRTDMIWVLAARAFGQDPLDAPLPAADPTPTRQCADAARGTEVEVCLRLAADHPEEWVAIAAALRSHVDRATAPDRALLQALLKLMSEDTGAEGATELGRLGDPRATSPLVHAAETREDPSIVEAAVHALGSAPGGRAHLESWLLDGDARLVVRRASAVTLGHVGDPKAGDALVDALRQPRLPRDLRDTLLLTIEATWPERLASIERPVSRSGASWTATAGGIGLGYAMATLGHFGKRDLAPLGAVTGTLAGATGGYVLGRARPIEAEDAFFVTAAGVDGITAGALVGEAVTDTPEHDGLWLGGLGGGVVAYGAAALLYRQHRGDAGDVVEAQFVSAGTALALASALEFTRVNTAQGDALLGAGLGVAGGAAAGHLFAPAVSIRRADLGMVGLAATYGAGVGLLVPLGESTRSSLPAATAATSALVGYALAGTLDAPWDGIAGGASGMVLGGCFGAGIGLVIAPATDEAPRTAALIGGSGGLAVGTAAALLDADPLDDRDVVVAGLTTGFLAWQTLGWATWLEASPRGYGVAIAGPPLVGGAMALASREIDWPVTHSVGAASVALWGGYLGGSVAHLAGEDPLPWSLVGSDVGAVGGVLLLSPVVGTPPLVLGIADAGGVLVGAVGGLSTGFYTDDTDAIVLGSLVGAGLGFAGGVVAGTVLHRSGKARTVATSSGPFRPPVSKPWVSIQPMLDPDGHGAYGATVLVNRW